LDSVQVNWDSAPVMSVAGLAEMVTETGLEPVIGIANERPPVTSVKEPLRSPLAVETNSTVTRQFAEPAIEDPQPFWDTLKSPVAVKLSTGMGEAPRFVNVID
jgi:hypothetical protein